MLTPAKLPHFNRSMAPSDHHPPFGSRTSPNDIPGTSGCSAIDPMDSKREEDAAQLQLGEDFKDARCLWNAEVAIILEATVKKAGNKLKSLAMIEETLNYVNKFKNFKTKPAVTEARKYDSLLLAPDTN
eukprot:986422-Amorphochlora_amoeboformis.AAC.1